MSKFFKPFKEEDLLALQDMSEIRSLHPRRFEWFCKFFLQYLGYDGLYVTNKFGEYEADGGVDLLGKFAGQRTLIQCKRWNYGKEGYLPVTIIRELAGCMLRDKFERGAVIVPLKFSATDRREAKQTNIELIGTDEIVATMKRINENFSEK